MTNFNIVIKDKAFKKIKYFVELSPVEISGLGRIVQEGNRFIIEDIFLFKQSNTGATTNIDQSAVGEFVEEQLEKGEDVSGLKLWWHSHGHLATFWSGIDDATIENFENTSYFVSLVANKVGDIKIRLDIFSPVRATFDDLPFTIETDKDSALYDDCRKEFQEKAQ